MGDLLDLGWIPDAIARAFFEFIRSMLVSAINFMFNFGLKPLLNIDPAIMTSTQITTAWDDVFRLSIALLPILIAAGLIVMPFSQDREASLWNMVARVVAVIFFIAISQPLFGFLIEASNAVTNALAPPTFVLTFNADLGGGWGSTLGLSIEVVALFVAVPLMLVATIAAAVLLVLRQFIVVTVAVGAPFFAVLWYANWGPMKAISNFASTWLRMGVYALLVGPIIGLVMRVFNAIAMGGISATGDISEFYVSAALALIFPIILFVVIWKTIGWAGQPLGVDAAFTMTVAAAIAATGVGAVAAGAGGAAAAGGASSTGAKATGGGGSAAGTSPGAGAASSGGTASDPSASTGSSTVGGTMRSSISDAIGPQESPIEEGVDPAPGYLSRSKDSISGLVSDDPRVNKTRAHISKAGTTAKKVGSKAKTSGLDSARKALGTETVDKHRRSIRKNLAAADDAEANRDFLTEAYQNGEFDVTEASSRDILAEVEEPAEGVSTVSPDAEGKVTYETATGESTTIDINDKAQHYGQQAASLRDNASKSARSVKRLRSAQRVAKTSGRTAITAGQASKQAGTKGVKASGIVFAGAMTRSPYAAYNMGKRGGNHLIGPGNEKLADSTRETDIDWSAQREGPSQALTSPLEDGSEGEQSEGL